LSCTKVNWSKRITRNLINSHQSITCLPNNQYAISFNEYNWVDNPDPNLQTQVWILDANGSIISRREFNTAANPISLFPNPCSDYLQVSLDKNQKWPLAYSIFNVKGDIVAQGQIKEVENSIDTRQLPTGQYLLNLEGAGSAKFLKK